MIFTKNLAMFVFALSITSGCGDQKYVGASQNCAAYHFDTTGKKGAGDYCGQSSECLSNNCDVLPSGGTPIIHSCRGSLGDIADGKGVTCDVAGLYAGEINGPNNQYYCGGERALCSADSGCMSGTCVDDGSGEKHCTAPPKEICPF